MQPLHDNTVYYLRMSSSHLTTLRQFWNIPPLILLWEVSLFPSCRFAWTVYFFHSCPIAYVLPKYFMQFFAAITCVQNARQQFNSECSTAVCIWIVWGVNKLVSTVCKHLCKWNIYNIYHLFPTGMVNDIINAKTDFLCCVNVYLGGQIIIE